MTRICDVTNIFGDDYLVFLQGLIDDLENVQNNAIYCQGQRVGVQLGVYIERDNRAYFHNSGGSGRDGQRLAAEVHNRWGVGYPTDCGNTGLLLYLALYDDDNEQQGGRYYRHSYGSLYISRGDALMTVLSDAVLETIKVGIQPFLEQSRYGPAIQYAVTDLQGYLQGENPDTRTIAEEQKLLVLFGVLALLLYFIKCWIIRRAFMGRSIVSRCATVILQSQRKYLEHKLQEVCQTTTTEYTSYHRALAGEEGRALYMPSRCPICLVPFPPDLHDDTDVTKEPHDTSSAAAAAAAEPSEDTPLLQGSHHHQSCEGLDDNNAVKPLLILPCGHVYDYACIVDWFVHQRSKRVKPSCPICLQGLKFTP